MKNCFSIGQMSKLHNIPIKTLRYYDEIGLFSPAFINKDNQYRYYTTEQFEYLSIIVYLKGMGVSLKQIKNHLSDRNIDGYLQLLEEQKRNAQEKINELNAIISRVESRITEVNETFHSKSIGEVRKVWIKPRQIIQLSERLENEMDIELGIRKLETGLNTSHQIFIGKVGLTISKENIMRENYQEYNSLFIILDNDITVNHMTETIAGGDFACISFRGLRKDSFAYYQKLKDYIRINHLEIDGNSIERVIVDEYLTNDKDRFFTEIQIPIKSV